MRTMVSDMSGLLDLSAFEEALYDKGYDAVCGVDECGRGPLAGPVVAAAAILPHGLVIDGLDDSKKLTPQRRENVFERIAELGLVCAVGVIDHETIDRINVHKASLMAMRKAVMDLRQNPDFILVDGKFCIPNISHPQCAVVGGDGRCACIGAASIIAKVTRDRIMDRYQAMFPSYSFAAHKGYPTAAHFEELKEHGPCEIHRRSFRPVAEVINEYSLF